VCVREIVSVCARDLNSEENKKEVNKPKKGEQERATETVRQRAEKAQGLPACRRPESD
jgi:hypothetical protein